ELLLLRRSLAYFHDFGVAVIFCRIRSLLQSHRSHYLHCLGAMSSRHFRREQFAHRSISPEVFGSAFMTPCSAISQKLGRCRFSGQVSQFPLHALKMTDAFSKLLAGICMVASA